MIHLMMTAPLGKDPVGAFYVSMPARYRELFDGRAAREHSRIVERRAGAPAHAEIWKRLPGGGAVICVVAPDRPGLLSFISAALVVQALDVVAAQVFTRASPDGPEAVDFFWLQREAAVESPVLASHASAIESVVAGLMSRELTIESVMRRTGVRPMPPAGSSTRVMFDDSPDAGRTILRVETFDRPGLLLAITQALSRARVQIIASEAQSRDGQVVDQFTLTEFDGTALRDNRRGVLRVEVLSAIDAVSRGEA